MKVKVYLEGGGDNRFLRAQCRQNFKTFFCKAGLKGRMPRIVASGGRVKAFEDFRNALKKAGAEDFTVLLVDSEDSVGVEEGSWVHLKRRDNWDKPAAATDDNAHLMAQCMESWFLADQDKLAAFFGDGFNRGALPARLAVEDIPKQDVLNGLKAATRNRGRKGEYHKGRHAFRILSCLDPEKVTAASPHARRLVETLLAKMKT